MARASEMSFLANLARPARAAVAVAHRHAGAAAVPARQGAVSTPQAIVHGARPINDLIHRAGFWALVFLGVTLAVTPLRRIVRYGNLIDVRRMLGVGAFCYIAAHLALFFADQGYNLGKVAYEITPSLVSHHRRHRLARTGRAGRDLDRRRWCAGLAACAGGGCIRSIYAIALLALIHYFQQTKADVTVPTFAAGLFLLADRLSPAWRGGKAAANCRR